jgi:hypothetical protein
MAVRALRQGSKEKTAMSEQIEALAGDLRIHVPVGAYLPAGQMDGDCRECHVPWPCPTAASRLAAMLDQARAEGEVTGRIATAEALDEALGELAKARAEGRAEGAAAVVRDVRDALSGLGRAGSIERTPAYVIRSVLARHAPAQAPDASELQS